MGYIKFIKHEKKETYQKEMVFLIMIANKKGKYLLGFLHRIKTHDFE